MEKSVEINENSRFFKDLELLKTTTQTREQTRITREEEDGLGCFGVWRQQSSRAAGAIYET